MKKSRIVRLAIYGLASALFSGCIGVHGTIRVVHVTEPGQPAVEPAKASAPTAEATPAKAVEPAKAEPTPAKAVQPEKKSEAPVAVAKVAPPAAVKPPPPAKRKADTLTLPATRDTRMTHHSSELDNNSGKSNRLRVTSITKKSSEFVLLDFDRAALKAFLDQYAGQDFEGKLSLVVREVQGGAAKVEVCALDSAVDWNEGDNDLKKAAPGEATAIEAQTGKTKWKTASGEEVEKFRDLIVKDDAVVALVNSKGVTADNGSGEIEIPLDDAFLRHLATDPNCRGIVLFHREPNSKVDFFSRDQHGKSPKLVVSTK